MESIVIGLPEYVIKKIVSKMPLILEVAWTGKPSCPQCGECHVRIKDSFWREIRNIRLHDRPSTLRVRCHKYVCQGCRRYFNTRLHAFLSSLQGRERVRVVCIDMNSAYRSLVRQWFPNAIIVCDRFHVIRLVQHHMMKTCKLPDEEHISYGRGGLMRLLITRRDRLRPEQCKKLQQYFETQPALQAVCEFCHELNELLRLKRQSRRQCKMHVHALLERIGQLCQSPFQALKTLGKTLASWQEEVARMFRFARNNGITEGFHRKMKLIQRRAYGFRNFENCRLRVRVLCGQEIWVSLKKGGKQEKKAYRRLS